MDFRLNFSNSQIKQQKFSNKQNFKQKAVSRFATIQTSVRASQRDAPESLKSFPPSRAS